MKNGKLPARRLALLSLAVMGFGLQSASGQIYNVTSNADDGSTGTLRWAIGQANYYEQGDIYFSANIGTITLQSPLPVITFQGFILGNTGAVINGNNLYRPFFIDLEAQQPAETLAISNLSIINGNAKGGNGGNGYYGGGGGMGAGGAIFINSGAVSLSNVTTSNSRAIGGNGGSYFYNALVSSPTGGGGGGLGGNGGLAGDSAGGGGGGFLGNGGNASLYVPNPQLVGYGGGGGGGQIFNGGNGGWVSGGGGGGSGSQGGAGGAGNTGDKGGAGGAGGGGKGGDNTFTAGNSAGTAGSDGGGGGGGGDGNNFEIGAIGYGVPGANGGNGGKFGGGGGSEKSGSAGDGGEFGGGGGSGDNETPGFAFHYTGNGGFGGGGGGGRPAGLAQFGNTNYNFGGIGGFGGGGGGTGLYQAASPLPGSPAYGSLAYGGTGSIGAGGDNGQGGGGGAALGGAIFVRGDNGASLTISDSSLDAGTVTGGSGGTAEFPPGLFQFVATGGSALGSSLFLVGGTTTISVGSGTQTISGSIADDSTNDHAAGITKVGPGLLLFTGANTYTGGTIISAGTLQIGNGGTAGSIVGNVVTNASLVFDRSDAVTFGGTISGSGSVTQLGTGTLMLTHADTYSGGTNVSSGTLDVVGNTLPSGAISIAGGTTLEYDTGTTTVVQVGATITGAGTLEKMGSGALIFGGNGVINISLSTGATIDVEAGIMAGSSNYQANWSNNNASLNIASGAIFEAAEGGINSSDQFNALTGAGTLRGGWTGNTNATATVIIGIAGGGGTFSGPITDNANGRLAISKNGSGTEIFTGTDTYTGGTTISGGTLQIGNGNTIGSITGNVTDNASLVFDRSDSVTFAGNISGSGTLTQSTSATLILTGTDTYGGSTSTNSGTVQIGNGGTTGSITGGVIDNGTLAFNRSDSITYSGAISGSGQITKAGAGTVILAGNDSLANSGTAVTISAGTLQFGNGSTGALATGNITDNAALSLNLSGNVTLGSTMSGTGSVTQMGPGTIFLTQNNTYSGGTTISGGMLAIGKASSVGSIVGNVVDNGTLRFGRADTYTFPGTISGSGAVTQTGGNLLVLTGNNTFAGTTTVSSGSLQIGNGGTSGLLGGNIVNNVSNPVTFNRSDNSTYAGIFSGSGGLTKTGAGLLLLTQANTYTGPTIISGGTLQLSPFGPAPAGYAAYYSFENSSGNTVTNGGSLGTAADATIGGSGTIVSGGIHGNALSFPSTTAVLTPNTAIAVLAPGGNGTHASTESAWFNGLNAPNLTRMLFGSSGGDSEAVLKNAAGYALGDISNGTQHSLGVDLAAYATGWHQLTVVQSEQTFTNTFYLDGQLAGSISNNFDYNAFNAFGNIATGGDSFAQKLDDIYVYNNQSLSAAQVLQLYNSEFFTNPLPTTTGVQLTASGATLDINGATQSIASLTGVAGSSVLLGSGSLTVGSSSTATTFSGSISGAGSFTKVGSATLIFAGANSYSGGTTISAGTLQIGSGGTSGSISGNIVNNFALTFNRSDSYAFAGNISGTGDLTQNGTGNLTLSGANTSTGRTFVIAGQLTIANLNSLGSGAVTVNSGATLQFANTFHGTVVISSLTVQPTANVDLAKTDLLIDYSSGSGNPYTNILASMKTAYDSGKWDSVGIRSSALVAGTSLAIYNNSVNTKSTFDGIATDSTCIFIKYTWLGDGNLDGIINSSDLSAMSSIGSTWQTGDFNYDAKVNADDYALFLLGNSESGGANISTTLPEPSFLLSSLWMMMYVGSRRRCVRIAE